MPAPLRVLVIIGTRPEAIKLAPVVLRLRQDRRRFRVRVCVTAQHRDLLDAALADFGLKPELDLDLMKPAQTPSEVLGLVITKTDEVLRRERPDLVIVQGDTTTVLGAALAAFHRKIPLGHVEAGLRSFDKWIPFPEERSRVLVDHLSDLLFAPTKVSLGNLRREGLSGTGVFVTGNTGVDALLWAAGRPHRFRERALRALPRGARVAVVTLHRRESFGKPLEELFRGLLDAARRFPELTWVYPVHPNPLVRKAAHRILRHPRILLLPPLGYLDFVHLMKRSEFVVTDSGGIQEEAPSLGKPVLILRDKTERPEGLSARGSRLVGVSRKNLLRELERLASRTSPRRPGNPFGDGKASDRIARAILSWAGSGGRPRNF